ncbi:MAG: ribosome recycling factor [Saprospiraceae bacterium]|nr:ribosome recycling factor [Saprospiraceae bacterium]
MEDIELIIETTKEGMNEATERLARELGKISTGKATPVMLDNLRPEYYGTPTALHQVANVTTADARTLIIQPWEKSMIGPIERAIFEANLGFTPQNDGQIIRINIPPLTQERRKEFVKRAKSLGEEARVSIRNARRDAMEEIKKAVRDGFPEDLGKRKEGEIQEMTTSFTERVERLLEVKEKDIMTV